MVSVTARARRLAPVLSVALLAALCLTQVLRLSLVKAYSLDEFQYSHAAWLVSKGEVPYRDFFEFHNPLPYQVLAVPYLFVASNPENIRFLRLAMLPFLALTAWGLLRVNRSYGVWIVPIGPLLVASAPAFITLATEIRPDPLAFSLFLASVAVLVPGRSGRVYPLASGALFALSVWGSQKALLYGGAVYPLAFVLDLAFHRAPGVPRLLGSPARWLAGVLAVAAMVAVYLFATHSARAWLDQTLLWAAQHERDYPGFPWTRYFVPTLLAQPGLFALGALGLARTLWQLARGPRPLAQPELLLVLALGGTLFSFIFARAPFPYALVPFLGILAAFAARGFSALLHAIVRMPGPEWGQKLVASATGVLCLGLVPFLGLYSIEEKLQQDNRYQYQVLAALNRLTAEDDPVYDNSGGYSARPHVGFRFYTSALNHTRDRAELAERIPREIQEAGCTAALHDLRFDYLPKPAQRFVREHFQPYNADLWLWGQRFEGSDLQGTFDAARDARYFVQPASILEEGSLRVDGQLVREPVLTLARGRHAVEYRGPRRDFFILWLPRNGERYAPALGLTPRFSTLF